MIFWKFVRSSSSPLSDSPLLSSLPLLLLFSSSMEINFLILLHRHHHYLMISSTLPHATVIALDIYVRSNIHLTPMTTITTKYDYELMY